MISPNKPTLSLGSASVTMPLNDLTAMRRYIDELEAALEGVAAERRAEQQHALAGDAAAMSAALSGAKEIASCLAGWFHPGETHGSMLPAEAYRALADGLDTYFGLDSPTAPAASEFRAYADRIDAYTRYRAGRLEAWKSPCAGCGQSRDRHAETDDPLVRGAAMGAAGEIVCQGYVPSAPMPEMPEI